MRTLTTTLLLLIYSNFFGQNHVKWTFEYDDINRAIVAYGHIDSTWHTYSINNKMGSGPVPTSISLEKKKGYKVSGKAQEISIPKRVFDPNFNEDLLIIDIIYIAKVPIKIKKESVVSGKVTYMICDDTKCYPPIDVPFSVKVKP
jgi:thiol:disulfide interchange protein DsbD